MLRLIPPALLATTLLWVLFFVHPRGFLTYILLPIALPFLAIGVKRWIESRRKQTLAPSSKLAGDGPSRDPMRYLSVAATVVRVTLLFVFSITLLYLNPGFSHWSRYPGVNVELALTTSPDLKRNAMREDVIMVSVARDGKVYFYSEYGGNEQIRFGELATMINKSVEMGSERRVYIKADRHVRYRMVKDVLDEVRSSRIEHVTFLVEQTKPMPVDEIRNVFRP